MSANMPSTPCALSVSIVTYRGDEAVLESVIGALGRSVQEAGADCSLTLIDNDMQHQGARLLAKLPADCASVFARIELIEGQGNVGYGAGHNLAIKTSSSRFHLILNPDAILEADAIQNALGFFAAHPDVVLLAPAVFGPNAQLQYLCRRPPAVLDLLLRGFAPAALRDRFAPRLAYYQMQDVINAHDVTFDPPIVSGCCMLFRREVLQQLGGFDERYFLYFEDYDLSLRSHARGRTAYVPTIRLTHLGGAAARKGMRHIGMFATSAWTFFSQHGWRWW